MVVFSGKPEKEESRVRDRVRVSTTPASEIEWKVPPRRDPTMKCGPDGSHVTPSG